MYAIIDVGSNSVRLNVFCGGQVIYRDLKTTRLGEGLATSGEIKKANLEKTIKAISAFIEIGKNYKSKVYIFGTATVRRAKNAKDFIEKLKEKTGKDIHVLSGEEESKIGFIGGTFNAKTYPAGVIDIGGASTEIAIGTDEKIAYAISYDVGAVKCYERAKDDIKIATGYVDNYLKEVTPIEKMEVFAIGGTATAIASILSGEKEYNREITDGFVIRYEQLKSLVENLYQMGKEQRMKITSIDKERGEIIGAGAIILKILMEKLKIDKVIASETDNLYGYYKTFVEKGIEDEEN